MPINSSYDKEYLFQQTFLGASIKSWNTSIGFNSNSTTMNIILVEDQFFYRGANAVDEGYHIWDEDAFPDGADKNYTATGDKFFAPVTGEPAYFTYYKSSVPSCGACYDTSVGNKDDILSNYTEKSENESEADCKAAGFTWIKPSNSKKAKQKERGIITEVFEFNGIVSSYKKYSGTDGVRYEVILEDPRKMLEGSQVILGGYAGTTPPPDRSFGMIDKFDDGDYSNVRTLSNGYMGYYNIINAFGYYEHFNFGTALTNANGFLWRRALDACQKILQGKYDIVGGADLERMGGPLYYMRDTRSAQQIKASEPIDVHRYKVDLSELDNLSDTNGGLLPDLYRLQGQKASLLSIVQTICETAGADFFVKLDKTTARTKKDDDREYSGVVKIVPLPKNAPIEYGKIRKVIEEAHTDEACGATATHPWANRISSESMGYEFRDPLCGVMMLGDKRTKVAGVTAMGWFPSISAGMIRERFAVGSDRLKEMLPAVEHDGVTFANPGWYHPFNLPYTKGLSADQVGLGVLPPNANIPYSPAPASNDDYIAWGKSLVPGMHTDTGAANLAGPLTPKTKASFQPQGAWGDGLLDIFPCWGFLKGIDRMQGPFANINLLQLKAEGIPIKGGFADDNPYNDYDTNEGIFTIFEYYNVYSSVPIFGKKKTITSVGGVNQLVKNHLVYSVSTALEFNEDQAARRALGQPKCFVGPGGIANAPCWQNDVVPGSPVPVEYPVCKSNPYHAACYTHGKLGPTYRYKLINQKWDNRSTIYVNPDCVCKERDLINGDWKHKHCHADFTEDKNGNRTALPKDQQTTAGDYYKLGGSNSKLARFCFENPVFQVPRMQGGTALVQAVKNPEVYKGWLKSWDWYIPPVNVIPIDLAGTGWTGGPIGSNGNYSHFYYTTVTALRAAIKGYKDWFEYTTIFEPWLHCKFNLDSCPMTLEMDIENHNRNDLSGGIQAEILQDPDTGKETAGDISYGTGYVVHSFNRWLGQNRTGVHKDANAGTDGRFKEVEIKNEQAQPFGIPILQGHSTEQNSLLDEVFKRVKKVADEFYGKKYLVPLPFTPNEVEQHLRQVSDEAYEFESSWEPTSEGGWVDVDISTPEIGKRYPQNASFFSQNGKLLPFAVFPTHHMQVMNKTLTSIKVDDKLPSAGDPREIHVTTNHPGNSLGGGSVGKTYIKTSVDSQVYWLWNPTTYAIQTGRATSGSLKPYALITLNKHVDCGIFDIAIYPSIVQKRNWFNSLGMPSNFQTAVTEPQDVIWGDRTVIKWSDWFSVDTGNIDDGKNLFGSDANHPFSKSKGWIIGDYETESTGRFGLAPARMKPWTAAVPLKSNRYRWGPWAEGRGFGKAELEIDSTFAPENFGGFDLMEQAAIAKLQAAVEPAGAANGVAVESGSVSLAGLPTIGTDVKEPTITGLQLFDTGPYISDVSIDIGANGVRTTYNMKTQRKAHKLNEIYENRMRKNAQDFMKLSHEIIQGYSPR
jgi:hypothetical protein